MACEHECVQAWHACVCGVRGVRAWHACVRAGMHASWHVCVRGVVWVWAWPSSFPTFDIGPNYVGHNYVGLARFQPFEQVITIKELIGYNYVG